MNCGCQEDTIDDEGGDKYADSDVEILGVQKRMNACFQIGGALLDLVFLIVAGNLFLNTDSSLGVRIASARPALKEKIPRRELTLFRSALSRLNLGSIF